MFLLVLILAVSVAGIALMGAMYRRDRSLLGLAGLSVLIVAGVLAAVYGALASE